MCATDWVMCVMGGLGYVCDVCYGRTGVRVMGGEHWIMRVMEKRVMRDMGGLGYVCDVCYGRTGVRVMGGEHWIMRMGGLGCRRA
jgi:hypothetical protein